MKKLLFITTIFILGLTFPTFSFAQGMMGFPSLSLNDAAIQSQQQEEQEGKKLLDDLSNKTADCSQLKDTDFEKIGEYFMGQSIGDTSRHILMNEMMKRMMGEKGEEQMHAVMGKRLSGCDTSAAFPSQDVGFMPMMNMFAQYGAPGSRTGMMGGWSSPLGSNQTNNSMMNFGLSSLGGFGWIFMILWWILIIVGVIMLIKRLTAQSHGSNNLHDKKKSPLEILKERYAKGEIDKKEFEERKKDLI
ncbi:MAG: SHOCT domain-containing protein [Patescibacteria group bacterium]